MAIICIDFDGSVVTHEFPKIGSDIGAIPVLKELIENGHDLILFTMRSDVDSPTSESPEIIAESGNYLTDACNWFKENEIPLWGVNANPLQHSWTSSPKPFAQCFIDDAAAGCPLIYEQHERPFVDWNAMREILIGMGFIKLK